MKLWIPCCLVVEATARPADSKPESVNVLFKDIYNPGGDKGFSTAYVLDDGTTVQSKGKLVKVVKDGNEVQALVITGGYRFYHHPPTGHSYTVTYTADENGYRPKIKIRRLGPTPIFDPIIFRSVAAPASGGGGGISAEIIASLLG